MKHLPSFNIFGISTLLAMLIVLLLVLHAGPQASGAAKMHRRQECPPTGLQAGSTAAVFIDMPTAVQGFDVLPLSPYTLGQCEVKLGGSSLGVFTVCASANRATIAGAYSAGTGYSLTDAEWDRLSSAMQFVGNFRDGY